MKILHCPTDCGSQGPLEARMERSLGHDSWSLVFNQSYIGYQADEVLGLRGLKDLFRTEYRRWNVLRRAYSYDVIHFNYGSSIVPTPIFVGVGHHGKLKRAIYNIYGTVYDMLDVKLLHRAGKVIAVTFQGGDARREDVLRAQYSWSDADEEPRGYYNPFQTLVKRRRADLWGRYADLVYYINPDLAWGLPAKGKFLPYVIVEPHLIPFRRKPVGKRIIFGHVVNHREPKGTRFILDAVNALRLEGHDFGFIMAERVDRSVAMDLYSKVDVMIEQLVIGWYGAQAVECMSMGIPVIAFIRQKDLRFIPTEMIIDLPIISATRDTITNVLRRVLKMSQENIDNIAKDGRAFVETWHDPKKIAAGLIKDYTNIKELKDEEKCSRRPA